MPAGPLPPFLHIETDPSPGQTLSPLLIVARVGLGLTHGNLSSHISRTGTAQLSTARFAESNTLRVDIHRSAVSDYETGQKDSFAMHAVKSEM